METIEKLRKGKKGLKKDLDFEVSCNLELLERIKKIEETESNYLMDKIFNFELILIYESENIELKALSDINQVFSVLQNEKEYKDNIEKIDFSSVFYLLQKTRNLIESEHKVKNAVLTQRINKRKNLI